MDYSEEKRDMTTLADKTPDVPGSGRPAQCKMITYFFGVQSMQVVVGTKATQLYRATTAATLFRPLMKAIVSEGSAINPTFAAIEMERSTMAGKIFHITIPGVTTLRFLVSFTNSSAEMRKDYRNTIGLSLSSFKKAPVVINRYGNVCLELKRSWLASSPRLVHISQVTNSRTKCSRCGEQGHNVRNDGNKVPPVSLGARCSVPCEGGGDSLHRRGKNNARSPPHPTRPLPPTPYRTSKMMETTPQPHQQQQQQHEQQQQQQLQQQQQQQQQSQEPQPSICSIITEAPDSMSQDGTAIIRGTEQILWTCPGAHPGSVTHHNIVSAVPRCPSALPGQLCPCVCVGVHSGAANTHWSTAGSLRAAVPSATAAHHTLDSSAAANCLAAWYSAVSAPARLRRQSPASHPDRYNTTLTAAASYDTPTTAADIITAPPCHTSSAAQQTPTTQQQIIVTHHQTSQSDTSQQQQQQLHVIQQQGRQVVASSQPSQHLHVTAQHTRQPAPQQQLPVITQQPSRHTAQHLTQLQQVPHKTSQINLMSQQMSIVHQHTAAPQPTVQQQRAAHQAALAQETQLHATDAAQTQSDTDGSDPELETPTRTYLLLHTIDTD
ncbi:hypothetical protein GWK47_005530 [Chionoecetes opilio]|uniref:V(D)J recombination-activating protein 1 RNase H domain-containing protein n=1 Tax=Chionoecetes opilio TaxID=41210 RepID=A0A8J4YGY6_CHIOP|nr:hypothetical protein GWK47_005530 [Chionoecetes opilio]